MAGSFLVIGWEGARASEPLELIEEFRPSGLIFFRRNYPQGGGEVLKHQLSQMRALASRRGRDPVILAIDNEGGLVTRLPEPHVHLPKACDYVDPAKAGEMAFASGTELAELG